MRRGNASSQPEEGMSLIVQLGTTVVSKPGSTVTGTPGTLLSSAFDSPCLRYKLL